MAVAMLVAFVFALCAHRAPASAQSADPLAEGRRHFDEARFARAIDAFDAVADGDELSRPQLVELFEARALAHHALDSSAAAERDLAALLSLEPEHALTALAPPALRRAFRRLAGEVTGRLTVETEASRVPDGFAVVARVRGDVGDIVREVRVSARADGAGRFETFRGERASVPARSSLAYYVEAFGPGGAVIATAGSRDAPLEASAAAADAVAADAMDARGSAALERDPDVDEEGGSAWPWILVGGGVLLAGAAAVLLVVLATSSSDGTTQVGAPMPGAP